MQAVRDFWAKNWLNKGIILGLVFIVCCCPLSLAGRGGSGDTTAAAPTSAPAQAAAAPTEEPTATTGPTETPAPPPGYVSRTTVGEEWPLSVEDGVLACDAARRVTFTSGGLVYAVNGTARGFAKENGWRDIQELTVPDPKIEGLIKSLQPLLSVGLELCK